MWPERTRIDRIILALVAIISREPDAVAAQVRQRLMDRIGMEEERVAGYEVGRMPDCVVIDRNAMAADRARMADGMFLVA